MATDLVRSSRQVMLREEHSGPDHRYLWAYLDQFGNLHIDGQDLGPGTAPVSSDGEYEWFQIIWSTDLPLLLELLDAKLDAPILDVLEANWTGPKSYELEARLRDSGISVKRFVWS